MTVAAPLSSAELAEAPCIVGECLERAATMATATVRIDPATGAPPDFETVVLGLPLCANHAHLLHRGFRLIQFRSGL